MPVRRANSDAEMRPSDCSTPRMRRSASEIDMVDSSGFCRPIAEFRQNTKAGEEKEAETASEIGLPSECPKPWSWSLKREVLILCSAVFSMVAAGQSLAAPIAEGVPPRALTDPKSIASQSFAGAAPVPLADLFFARKGMDAVWVPHSDAILISTNLTGRYNLWTMPANGGFPLQLTQSDARQFAVTASPDGKWIVFQSDRSGAEVYDLYATPASGGAVINLTNTPDVDEESAHF